MRRSTSLVVLLMCLSFMSRLPFVWHGMMMISIFIIRVQRLRRFRDHRRRFQARQRFQVRLREYRRQS